MSAIEVNVPDIGDFKEVEVIEVLVKAGDTIAKEQSLITVESDKASMEIPSSAAGVVKELRIKLGDKVSKGSAVLLLEPAAAEMPASTAAPPAAPQKPSQPAPDAEAAPSADGATPDIECDVLVIGAGPGGYSAAFRAADLGQKTVLVERYPTLGGVCLNVGCIPSKALLHVAAVMDEASHFAQIGVDFGKPVLDLDKLRAHKTKVVGKLTGGLNTMAKARKVTVLRGLAAFIGPHRVQVSTTAGDGRDVSGEKKVVRFAKAIIAAGSEAVKLPFTPDDPRIVDSTGALHLNAVPKRMLVIGGGIIGLEMATVYSTLGARIEVVEMLDVLMNGADRDLVRVWQKFNDKRFDKVMLKTKTVSVEAKADGILVKFEGEQAPSEPQLYDLVLVSVGRAPNGKTIGADAAGVNVTERGFVEVDRQMRTNVPHIFAIGDIVGNPMLAHKAVHEAHVAAEVAAGEKSYFDARVIPSVAYTDPEIAWAGITEDEVKTQGIKVKVGKFPWQASGPNIRALQAGRGFAKDHLEPPRHPGVGLRVKRANAVGERIFLEGNAAAALGCLYGGATVCAWYPITPSSSLAEAFQKYCQKYRHDPETKEARYAIVQAEDEIASIGIVTGAGWNGARAFTATSGPGVSLMTEFIGLAYFAEIPIVIIDVQRGGPSTGMPTRTQQADLVSSAYASHGDTKHVMLLPQDPAECFEHAATALDLAERLQTPVFVMSDLDIGMNQRLCAPLQWDDERRMDRGKVLTAEQLDAGFDFGRYKDVDGDGIPWRTLPGTHESKGAYFTRGTTRDAYARYSETGPDYTYNVQRLLVKFASAATLVPQPVVRAAQKKTRLAVIYFGSTAPAMDEALETLAASRIHLDAMRLRAFPFAPSVAEFIAAHDQVFVVEQNRDAQMRSLLVNELEVSPSRLSPVLHYDGTPITARYIAQAITQQVHDLATEPRRERA